MTLYSYIVTHDTGFAPNPFFGYCTLACCKPGIRKHAKKGDWIVGLTPLAKGVGNKIVYFMEVDESLSFDDYWRDPRFKQKRPKLDAGSARRSGDNIYKPLPNGDHYQLPSAHSKPKFSDGQNAETKCRDVCRGERVLISRNFVYYGSKAKELPRELARLKVGRSYRCHFLLEVQEAFRKFVSRQRNFGMISRPHDWRSDDGSWKGSDCGKS
ncbi:MAG: hypothetical protein ABSC05_32230 [Candidatus Solibacter sp.]|jgi:hypothetical protein